MDSKEPTNYKANMETKDRQNSLLLTINEQTPVRQLDKLVTTKVSNRKKAVTKINKGQRTTGNGAYHAFLQSYAKNDLVSKKNRRAKAGIEPKS